MAYEIKRLSGLDHYFPKLICGCRFVLIFFFFLWRCDPTRVMASSFLRFLDHTQRRTTVGRSPLDEWSARRRDLYLTTHNTHNRQTSMSPVGFEPTISAGERPQTYALDRAATGTGLYSSLHIKLYTCLQICLGSSYQTTRRAFWKSFLFTVKSIAGNWTHSRFRRVRKIAKSDFWYNIFVNCNWVDTRWQ